MYQYLWFLSFINACLSLRMQQMSMSSQPISQLIIQPCPNKDIPRVANFLGQFWFDDEVEISRAQRLEFTRLENNDLSKRYSERVGAKKYQSVLLVALEDEEIIGCVGLDCQRYNPISQKFITIYDQSYQVQDDELIVPVLANLVIRKDRRKQGLAKTLLQECDTIVKSWGYNDIYLQVSEENIRAQNLYKSKGYKLVYTDENASCIVPSRVGLRTQACTNYCYRKTLSPMKSGSNNNGSEFFKSLFNLFNKR